eukprot:TRINITY_DN4515_c0_g1_i2.p1 TRINITY_DN4515_c0_g1~~TRINITY_DN4515_c0_g1_i2.p1  ORF type:complete len:239 (+),score=50.43 TRINITY_DN4515_c0_g1_i2:117-833(+)
MFSYAARAFVRQRYFAAAASAVATVGYSKRYIGNSSCDFKSHPSAKSKGGVSINVGKEMLKLYFAEFSTNGTIDLHKDLSFAQLKTLFEASGGKPSDCKKMFEMMDTDGSNTVDFAEIVAFFCQHASGSLHEKASLFFHTCDVDCSGSIEPRELKDVVLHLMKLKCETEGKRSFFEWNQTLYADIPMTYVLHLQANEFVNDVFSTASKDGEQLSEKEFQKWLLRGGKHVNRLNALFNM